MLNKLLPRDVNVFTLKKDKVRTLARLQDTMMLTKEGRRVRGEKYRRRKANKGMVQTAVDGIIRVAGIVELCSIVPKYIAFCRGGPGLAGARDDLF
jgi:hypothetical protein